MLSVIILIGPVACKDPGMVIESPPREIITVKGQDILLNCSVKGTVSSSLCSSWNVSFPPSQHRQDMNIHDNSTNTYHVAIYTTDLCIFVNRLIILNASLEQNNTTFSCIESVHQNGIEPLYRNNTAVTLSE